MSVPPPVADEGTRMRRRNTEHHDRSKGVRRQCFRGTKTFPALNKQKDFALCGVRQEALPLDTVSF